MNIELKKKKGNEYTSCQDHISIAQYKLIKTNVIFVKMSEYFFYNNNLIAIIVCIIMITLMKSIKIK